MYFNHREYQELFLDIKYRIRTDDSKFTRFVLYPSELILRSNSVYHHYDIFYYIVKELSTLLLYYIYLYFPNVFRIFFCRGGWIWTNVNQLTFQHVISVRVYTPFIRFVIHSHRYLKTYLTFYDASDSCQIRHTLLTFLIMDIRFCSTCL